MDKFGKSQPVRRVEDMRFLTGQGRYLEDIAPAGALRAWVLRSPVAHGTITHLDLEMAREAEGVQAILTLADLEAAGISVGMDGALVDNRDGSKAAAPERPMLARDRVRFVGEPIAVVIAQTLEQARDTGEMIELDIDDLPAKVDLAVGGEQLHAEAPDNRAFDWGIGDEAATEAAFASAAHRVALQVEDNRIIVNTMEPRGCFANWAEGRLQFTYGGQGVWAMKKQLSDKLGLASEDVHVTTPDVGGGFGMKAMPYPEYFVVAQAARLLGRPVLWMSDRSEAMLSDNAGRDLTSLAELAFDADLRITGYRVHSQCNLGAYNSHFGQPVQTQLFSRVLAGVYDIDTTWLRVEGIYTNTAQVDAYRGAGRPEAIYVLERAMDHAARELGVDPWELRRRNFIRADQFPYKTATDETYDVGDFHQLLARTEAAADLAGFAARREADALQGNLRGVGLCYYIESILGDPSESAEVAFEEEGRVSIYVGTQSNGQGHETVYAQFLADQTGIPAEDITVIQGDSDRIAQGGGTGGSRSVTTQANATLATVDVMIDAFTPFLAEQLGVEPESVSFDGEQFSAPGSNQRPTLVEAAEMARAQGCHGLLRHTARAKLPGRSFPNGAHVAEIVIDPETGVSHVDRYTVVDDFGNLINPLLAEGQVHGGVVQGMGQALLERVVYDADGQLLTASFMDYALPRAADVPMIDVGFAPVPSTQNPMGMKGCGEAGTVGALAAVANAVQDAVHPRGVRQIEMPYTPLRLWEALRNVADAAE
ncbi:xanthine dehydrogenase family protein molybdopterin-binding subunit [Phaeobacter gallaeciensis]|uniref:Molybdenum-containing hydroxylase n=1 Tax=Phaeobacter gallaeciensis TaxID=60890 RepID=A0AAC9Z9B7_9RHOB|nr:xanthine dehydrogenase family protein molybdopterin-binding subunit [Phaeobacter gallaeciensis]AHD10068.1 Aerobic-type carbon monoxide dehydrogenase, large subunit CoxL/CutL-like protein [Phaeobacter gallaeciensis DSM 26640]ATE93332.1 molybdenum-containing hydroxylase [Phaeobacter gallaeciensis]ATE96847.1 molybdenum-containing hydroxylase [Phaeobacter gallaeciensis]ATF01996.1 molybdenum-containing hydroxylase [Phaeobacter gallaeciensis]ATF06376.1 molybdenum-containing hydroxylase [Phaeobact